MTAAGTSFVSLGETPEPSSVVPGGTAHVPAARSVRENPEPHAPDHGGDLPVVVKGGAQPFTCRPGGSFPPSRSGPPAPRAVGTGARHSHFRAATRPVVSRPDRNEPRRRRPRRAEVLAVERP